MTKKLRDEVYLKYDKHCAYCGKEITIEKMQIDHIISKRLGGTNNLENLNPSCRRCNYYKAGNTLEGFRKALLTLHERLLKVYIVRIAIDYGLLELKPFNGVFYFEKVSKKEE